MRASHGNFFPRQGSVNVVAAYQGAAPHIDISSDTDMLRGARQDHRGPYLPAEDASSHWLKSMDRPHCEQVWVRSNSSEKISFSWPHWGHLQMKAFRFLNC
jgi:hypothetical protein